MVAPVIAIGVYELLAAGAAATGLGAVAVARRRELSERLSDAASSAQQALRTTTLHVLPYIIGATTGVRPQGLWRHGTDEFAFRKPVPVSGLDLNLDSIRPWSPPIVHNDDVQPIVRPRPMPVPFERMDGGRTGSPTPPNGPEDPLSGLRHVAEGAARLAGRIKSVAGRVAQNPLLRGAAMAYKWYVYGSTVVALAEISRRMIVDDPQQVHGPILYDYVYEPLLGSSAAVRTFLGGHQVMSAETSAGMVAVALARRLIGTSFAGKFLSPGFIDKFVSQLPSFLSVHGYAAFGNLSFFEHQITANNTTIGEVDVDRATRTAGFFGFTSIAYFPITAWLINLPSLGRTGFREWWMRWGAEKMPAAREWFMGNRGLNWSLAQMWRGMSAVLGPQLSAVVAPHYVPRMRTWLAYAAFATAYRSGTQAVASLPVFEDSNMAESMQMTAARNVASVTLFDPYFYLAAKSNSLRSMFGNQLVFMGLIWGLNRFFSPFDGKDVAVKEADRTLREAAFSGTLQQAVLSKPLTQRNFWVPPYVDLSAATWAQLSRQYANGRQRDARFISELRMLMKFQLASNTLDNRRVGMALGVMLSQLGLAEALRQDGVYVDPRHIGTPLELSELTKVFQDINNGLYDEVPLFQFPRNPR